MATTDSTTGLDHPTVVPENFDPDSTSASAEGDEPTGADGRADADAPSDAE